MWREENTRLTLCSCVLASLGILSMMSQQCDGFSAPSLPLRSSGNTYWQSEQSVIRNSRSRLFTANRVTGRRISSSDDEQSENSKPKYLSKQRRRKSVTSSSAAAVTSAEMGLDQLLLLERESMLSAEVLTTQNKKKYKLHEPKEFVLQNAVFKHEILTKEEEQKLGDAIQKAKSLQSALSKLLEEKRVQQDDLEMSIMNALGEDEYEEDEDLELSPHMSVYGMGESPFYDSSFGEVDDVVLSSDDLLLLKRFDSSSRITKAVMLESDDDEYNYSKYTGGLQEVNFYESDLDMLTDEEIREHLEISGGKAALQKALYDGAVARDTLICSNIKLVNSIAKKWARMHAKNDQRTQYSIYNGSWDRPSLNEAIQEGVLGLTKAAERYNPGRGLRFSTYATYWITNSVRQCFQKASTGCLRLPSYFYDTKSKMKRIVKEYCEFHGHTPSYEYIAEEMGMSQKRLKNILKLVQPLVALDTPVSAEASTLLSETLENDEPDPEYQIELSFLRQSLENALATELAPHERDILRLRLGLDDGQSRTYTQIAQECFGGAITASEARTTAVQAFKKLRSPHSLSTYKLLAYIDFADIDRETMKMR